MVEVPSEVKAAVGHVVFNERQDVPVVVERSGDTCSYVFFCSHDLHTNFVSFFVPAFTGTTLIREPLLMTFC